MAHKLNNFGANGAQLLYLDVQMKTRWILYGQWYGTTQLDVGTRGD